MRRIGRSVLAALVGLAFLVGFAVQAVPAQAQYGGTPTLTLDVTQVAPGGPVTVTVTGCDANHTSDIIIDGVIVGTGTTDANGEFSVQVNVPSTALGVVNVSTICGGNVLSGQVTVVRPGGATGTGADGTLPFTGSNGTSTLVQVGIGLIGLGALLVFVVPQRRQRAREESAAAAH